MILNRIEMVGFKSFADRTVIDFTDSFTAIVGPNGCGKSNVSDAIRWVLGEQRVKDLRADSMQDVIFNGTEKRKSLSYCEVSLHFDNSTRYFNFNSFGVPSNPGVYAGETTGSASSQIFPMGSLNAPSP